MSRLSWRYFNTKKTVISREVPVKIELKLDTSFLSIGRSLEASMGLTNPKYFFGLNNTSIAKPFVRIGSFCYATIGAIRSIFLLVTQIWLETKNYQNTSKTSSFSDEAIEGSTPDESFGLKKKL